MDFCDYCLFPVLLVPQKKKKKERRVDVREEESEEAIELLQEWFDEQQKGKELQHKEPQLKNRAKKTHKVHVEPVDFSSSLEYTQPQIEVEQSVSSPVRNMLKELPEKRKLLVFHELIKEPRSVRSYPDR